MSLVRQILHDAAIGVGVAHQPEDLDVIHKPGVAAALWQRRPDPEFQAWIDGLLPDQLPEARVILRPHDVQAAVTTLCDKAGTPKGPERRRLIEDISAQATIFAGLMGAAFLRLRLDVIAHDACRKFHLDAITARLICTYRGTGTQYGISTDGAEPAQVFTVPTGAPIVLRGTLWPTDPPAGLLHRSPPIAGSGETRLLLVLDPVEDAANTDRTTLH